MIEIENILDAEKHLNGIEAVIFDLDDTLYPEKDYVKSGYQAIAKAYPQIPTMFDELWAAFEQKTPAIDLVLGRHGMTAKKDDALHLYRFHAPELTLDPTVREMLVRIKKEKKLGLLTDGRPEGQRAKIKALGLEDAFDAIIVTDELGGIEFRKPCERAFSLICNALHVPAEKTVYIGDNIAKDFIAPEKLGMQCIWFRNKTGLYEV